MFVTDEAVDEVRLSRAIDTCDGDHCDWFVDGKQQFFGLLGQVEL